MLISGSSGLSIIDEDMFMIVPFGGVVISHKDEMSLCVRRRMSGRMVRPGVALGNVLYPAGVVGQLAEKRLPRCGTLARCATSGYMGCVVLSRILGEGANR